jgi:glyoxylase I family protein
MTVVGYHHVALPIRDVERAARFYGDVLGLTRVERPGFGIAGAWFEVGGAQLHLLVVDGTSPPNGRMPHVALSVPRERLEALTSALADSEGTELSPLHSRTDGGTEVWSAMYADPDGNVVELTDLGVAG